MFSVNQLLALNQSTSVVHSLVDAFFEAKKVILKARLRDSMETVVEGVFAELEQQFQESLLKEEEQDDVVDGGDKAVVAVDERAQNDQLVPYIAPAEIAATVATAPAVYVESISNEAIPSSKNPDQQSSKEVIIPNTLVLAVKSKPGPSSAVQVKRPFKEEDGKDEEDEDKEVPVSNASRKKIKHEVKEEEEEEEEDEKEVVASEGESIATTSTSVTTRSKKDSKQTKISSSSSKKSYACTFSSDSCAYESPIKFSVVRHILNVHLKKSAAGIQENEDKDPSKYLAIKEA